MARVNNRDFGTAYLFDGANTTVVIPHNANQLLTGGFTISAWINPRTVGENGNGDIVDKSTSNHGVNGYVFRLISNGRVGININNTTDIFSATQAVPVGKSIWFHVLATVDVTGFATIYVNGVVSGNTGTTGLPSVITTTNALTIGNRSTATDHTFDGIIDAVRIWNRVLTAAEVNASYAIGISRGSSIANGLIGEWLFDEGSGTTAKDIINSNDGVITAGTGGYTTNVPMLARQTVTRRIKVREFGTCISGADGSNSSQVDFGNILDATNNSFSTSFWFRPIMGSVNGSKIIIGKKLGTLTAQAGWYVGAVSSIVPFDKVVVGVSDGTNPVTIVGLVSAVRGAWNFCVVNFDRTAQTVSIYMNGVLDSTTSISTVGSLTNASTLRALRDGSNNNKYGGALDSLRLYNRVLTSVEVADMFYDGTLPLRSVISGEWLFNEGDGTVALDSSGAGNNGTVSTAVYSSDSPMHRHPSVRDFGNSLSALSVNSSKVVYTDSASLRPTTAFTSSIWVKIIPGTAQLDVFSRAAGTSDFTPRISTTGTIRFNLVLSSANVNFTSTKTISFGVWHHIVCVYDSATGIAKVYVDGLPFSTGTGTGTLTNTGNWQLNTLNGSSYGDCYYDNLKMWNVALSASDIETLFYEGVSSRTGLALDCNFNEGSGSTAGDSSGNNNNGAITGATYSTDVVMKSRLTA